MSGAVTQKQITVAEAEAKAKHRRRVLKQKVRRGEVLKLINLGIKRYDQQRKDRWIHRRIARSISRSYLTWDVRLSTYAVSLRVLAQRKLLEPALDRVLGRTLIVKD